MAKTEMGFEIFEDDEEVKTAKDVMLQHAKKDESLFDDDEDYITQCEDADKKDMLDSARAFLGVKPVKACYNCGWNKGGLCYVMIKFNSKLLLPTVEQEKCKHWKKIEQ